MLEENENPTTAAAGVDQEPEGTERRGGEPNGQEPGGQESRGRTESAENGAARDAADASEPRPAAADQEPAPGAQGRGSTGEESPSDVPQRQEPRRRRPRRAASRAAGPPPTLANPFLSTPAEAEVPPAEDAAGSAGDSDASGPASAQAPATAAVALFQVPQLPAAAEAPPREHAPDDDDAEQGEAPQSRRRGRNRRRGPGAKDEADGEQSGAKQEPDDQQASGREGSGREGSGRGAAKSEASGGGPAEQGDTGGNGDRGAGAGTKKRRRRKRGAAAEVEADADDPNTVTKVRAPKESEAPEKVAGVKGSTRLEAKKQRRREGREAGRRRAPILSEAEFLARREAVDRGMVVRQLDDVTQIAVLEDGVLVEHYVTKEAGAPSSMVGNVYLGRVQNVLPSMEAAFVDIGRGRNAVLYAGEVNWDAAGLDGQPKRIEFALKSGDPVLVQVTKDPVGHKGARLTSQVSLPGRYLVFVPDGSMTGISRKLPDKERSRLRTILKRIVPDDVGVIVRTAAEGISEDELARDVARLEKSWQEIQRKSKSASPPQLLYAEPDLAIRVVRDIFNEDFASLTVAGNKVWRQVKQYVDGVAPDLAERVAKWNGSDDIFAHHRIDEQLAKALDRKVWLPSGGSLIIEHTEAMTVIDVNTGRFTGQGGNLEETVTQNNLEAAEEIVRQVRLRDIGGIIVIDFIDMVLEGNRDLVLRRLVECLGRDRTKHQVTEITSLGLAQMTRKRIGGGLLEIFSETCDACAGRGVRIHLHGAGAPGTGKRKAVKPSGAHDPVEMMMRSQDGEAEDGNGTAEADDPKTAPPGQSGPADAVETTPEAGAAGGDDVAASDQAGAGEEPDAEPAVEPPVHEVAAAESDEPRQDPAATAEELTVDGVETAAPTGDAEIAGQDGPSEAADSAEEPAATEPTDGGGAGTGTADPAPGEAEQTNGTTVV